MSQLTNNIIEQVLAIQEAENLSNRQIAKEADVNEGILSPLLKGKEYKGDTEKYLQRLQTWLNTRNKQVEEFNTVLKEPDYLPLPTSQVIWKLMDMARKMQRWSMVYEGSGIGKTVTAEAYQREHNNVWIVTASDFCKSARAILSELCDRMGIKHQGMTAARMNKLLEEALTGSNGLIIIDEAQYLSDNVLNGLRILAEHKCGVFLLGNDVVRSRMSAVRSQINMNAIWSRMIRPTCIKTSSTEDIRNFMRAWGIEDDALHQTACRIVPSTKGQLRTLADMIKMASSSAMHNNDQLTPHYLEAAHRYCDEVKGA